MVSKAPWLRGRQRGKCTCSKSAFMTEGVKRQIQDPEGQVPTWAWHHTAQRVSDVDNGIVGKVTWGKLG